MDTTSDTHRTPPARRLAHIVAAVATSIILASTALTVSTVARGVEPTASRADVPAGGDQLVRPAATSSVVASRAPVASQPRPYCWPLAPHDRQHPVRGYFNDPREGANGSKSFHFGIDISAPDGTAVHAVEAGVVHLTSGRAVAVQAPSGRITGYWHVVPAVRHLQRVAKHEVIGHIERDWGHVHFSERLGRRYVNPLRPGALTPYADHTAPTIAGIRVDKRKNGWSELVVDAYDTVPVPVAAPWNDMPVTPVLVRWRLVDASGEARIDWRTGSDFRHALLDRSRFSRVYGPGTHKNRPPERGRYCFRVGGWSASALPAGAYRIEVEAADTGANRTTAVFLLVLG